MRHPPEINNLGNATAAWQKGPRHKFYEDRFRMLCLPIPLVKQSTKGEVFAVMDGVGSAPQGMAAAQKVSDILIKFFESACGLTDSQEALHNLLQEANQTIYGWGMIPETTRPQGACAGTVVWIDRNWKATIFHAGDTTALLIRDGTPKQLTTVHQSCDGHLSNYFGLAELPLDIKTVQLEESDRILIFSDGIGKAFFANQQVADIVESQPTRQASLNALFLAARNAGSDDDATAILVDIEPFY
jgi:serine/threonine protein phosphatase PrpC